MKIEAIDTYRVGERFLLVEIATDTGLAGLGETGLWGYPDAPGIGVELNHEALADFPASLRPIEPSTPLRDDGSVADSWRVEGRGTSKGHALIVCEEEHTWRKNSRARWPWSQAPVGGWGGRMPCTWPSWALMW
ncbi:MAG: hypothetical protein U9R48_11260 [Chloroflexota bacterium]|nr:hypothetical protein [Chloroflexota bacterium]